MRRCHFLHVELAGQAEFLDLVLAALDDGHLRFEGLILQSGRGRRRFGNRFQLGWPGLRRDTQRKDGEQQGEQAAHGGSFVNCRKSIKG